MAGIAKTPNIIPIQEAIDIPYRLIKKVFAEINRMPKNNYNLFFFRLFLSKKK